MFFNALVDKIFNRFAELFLELITNNNHHYKKNLDLIKDNILKAVPHIKSSISIYVDIYGCEETNLDGFIDRNMDCFKEELLELIYI